MPPCCTTRDLRLDAQCSKANLILRLKPAPWSTVPIDLCSFFYSFIWIQHIIRLKHGTPNISKYNVFSIQILFQRKRTSTPLPEEKTETDQRTRIFHTVENNPFSIQKSQLLWVSGDAVRESGTQQRALMNTVLMGYPGPLHLLARSKPGPGTAFIRCLLSPAARSEKTLATKLFGNPYLRF